jgi:hypothetical protein
MNANDRPVEPSGPDGRFSRRGFLAGAAGLSAGAMVGRQAGVAHAEVGGSGLHGAELRGVFQHATIATPPPAAAAPPPGLTPTTTSPIEVTRRVASNGSIRVAYQSVSAGRQLAGQIVTVRLQPTVLQVFFAGQLVRTVPRRSTKEVVQLQAHRPHRPTPRPKTDEGSVNHHPKPLRKASSGTRQR